MTSLIEELKVSPAKLLSKYHSYKKLVKEAEKPIEVIIHELFNIPLNQPETLFFIAYGLKVLESQIDYFLKLEKEDA